MMERGIHVLIAEESCSVTAEVTLEDTIIREKLNGESFEYRVPTYYLDILMDEAYEKQHEN